MRIFVSRSKKFFYDISISGGRTGERDVSGANAVPEPLPSIFFFRSKIFFFEISHR